MFSPLYVQTEYSILQSACKLDPLFEKLVNFGYKNCAICDEGTMYGTIKFYQGCTKKDIKPLIGLKIKYAHNEIEDSLILYAMNIYGYKNLMKISSNCVLNNGVVDFEFLQKSSIGILAIVPLSESRFINLVENGDYQSLSQQFNLLKYTFDILYVGLDLPKNIGLDIFRNILAFSNENKIKTVALPKVSFLNSDDIDAYVTLKSIKNNANLYHISKGEESHYLMEEEELLYHYRGYESLIDETEKIASSCNVIIEFGKYQLPCYDENIDAYQYLKELCITGLNKRLQMNKTNISGNTYYQRLQYELETINQMGFCDYFLIVFDYVRYAKRNNIYVGPGRGSAPASLVSYSLGITDIDPLKYNLLFERFLNKERISMPDIDIDFQDDLRDEVIKYVGRKYSKNKVAHIATFGTFKIKLAINDSARVYKLSEQKIKLINKYLTEALKDKHIYSANLADVIESSVELLQLMDDFDDIRKVLTVASKIQGIPRNISTHAAGIVITKYDLVNYTPLDEGLDDIYQTQYEASDLEALGLLKMDFLGLKNLTNIAKTIELIKKDIPSFSLPKEDDDIETYKMLASGDVTGVFQLESQGMRKVIMNLETSSFDDITHALALYRPGPMDIIPSFINRKFKKEEVIYPHKDLEQILKETYGTIVYQDQIMLIACKFAGYSLGRADILRRAVSKKKKEVLEVERRNFVSSSIKEGYSEVDANLIYDYIVKFADYGFNKAHSVAYAKVAYITAYLKRHYFSYYFSTLMTSFMGSSSDVIEYTKEATSKKVKVIGPSINHSTDEFIVLNNDICFPLSIIRGLGVIKTNELLVERTKAKFEGFEDFVKRTKDIIASSILENIIYSGALDEFNITKKAMIDNYKNIINQNDFGFIKDIVKINYSDEEYNYGYLQEKELEVLGINIKYNIFAQCAPLYTKYNLNKVNDIQENTFTKTFGIIKKIKEIKTKQQETMAFIELSDDTSTIELVLFPRVYNRFKDLKTSDVVMVKGNVQKRTTLQIVVDDIKKI